MFSIPYAVYLFALFTVVALLEIQIEGKDGWAKNLPCWRPKPDSLVAKIYARFMGGKELTGYHVVMFSLSLLILHLPFTAGTKWTLVKELEVFSAYFLVSVLWDFLWFIWNPHYGLKRFKPKFIWWHKKWIGPIPTDYLSGLLVSAIFASVAIAFVGIDIIARWGITLLVFGGLTLISCLISQLMRKGQV